MTRQAVLEAWDDAARLTDRKWERIFEKVVPRAQAHVARVLDLSRPGQVAFAPNTHELVMRLLSCLEDRDPLRILTTDAEFTSFARQAARLEELPRVQITRVPAEPFETFEARFREAVAAEPTTTSSTSARSSTTRVSSCRTCRPSWARSETRKPSW